MATLLFFAILPIALPSRIAHRIAVNELLQEHSETELSSLQDHRSSTGSQLPGLSAVASSTGISLGASRTTGARSGFRSRAARLAGATRPGRVAGTSNPQTHFKLQATSADGHEAHVIGANATSDWDWMGDVNDPLSDLLEDVVPNASETAQEKKEIKKAKKAKKEYEKQRQKRLKEREGISYYTEDKVWHLRESERKKGAFKDVEYEKGKMLGEGGYGKVYEGRVVSGPETIRSALPEKLAIKVIPTPDAKVRSAAKLEFAMQARLHHPNIVEAYDVYADADKSDVNLVMESVDGPKKPNGEALYPSPYGADTLKEEIESKTSQGLSLGYDRSMEVFKQLVKAVVYCHRRGIAHRDLKPANTFLVDEHAVKIGDFGMSFDICENHTPMDTNKEATEPYMAPDLRQAVFDAREYDLWSLGIMLYEMLTGHRPYMEEWHYANQFVGMLPMLKRIHWDTTGMSAELVELLEGLLSFNPAERSRGKALAHALQPGGLLYPLDLEDGSCALGGGLCEGWERVLTETAAEFVQRKADEQAALDYEDGKLNKKDKPHTPSALSLALPVHSWWD